MFYFGLAHTTKSSLATTGPVHPLLHSPFRHAVLSLIIVALKSIRTAHNTGQICSANLCFRAMGSCRAKEAQLEPSNPVRRLGFRLGRPRAEGVG